MLDLSPGLDEEKHEERKFMCLFWTGKGYQWGFKRSLKSSFVLFWNFIEDDNPRICSLLYIDKPWKRAAQMTKENRENLLAFYRAEICPLWNCFPIWLEMFWELERRTGVTIPKFYGYSARLFTSIFYDSRSNNSNPVTLHDLLSAGLTCTNKTCLEISLGHYWKQQNHM